MLFAKHTLLWIAGVGFNVCSVYLVIAWTHIVIYRNIFRPHHINFNHCTPFLVDGLVEHLREVLNFAFKSLEGHDLISAPLCTMLGVIVAWRGQRTRIWGILIYVPRWRWGIAVFCRSSNSAYLRIGILERRCLPTS